MGAFLGRPVVRGIGVAGGAALILRGVARATGAVKSKRGTPGSRSGGGRIGLVPFIDEGGVST